MGNPITVSINGTSTVIGNLNSLSNALQSHIQGLLEDAGNGTYDDSQAVVPVLTGELKASGHVDVGQLKVTVAYDADHAAPVELGHMSRAGNPVPAQSFLYPSFEQRSQQLINDLKALV